MRHCDAAPRRLHIARRGSRPEPAARLLARRAAHVRAVHRPARRIVVLAQQEAHRLNHSYIGSEHLLLGLVAEREGVAARALASFDVDLETVRQQVEEIIGAGQSPPSGHIPFTPRAKKVLELSLREALQLSHSHIGTEHLLLGLLREGEGTAVEALTSLGVDLQRVRQQVLRELGERAEPGEIAAAPGDEHQQPSCPGCGTVLTREDVRATTLQATAGEVTFPVSLVFCRLCGRTLGVLRDGGDAGK